jgi:hypothetical protein
MFDKLVGASDRTVYSAFEKLLERLETEVYRVISYEFLEREPVVEVVIQTAKKISLMERESVKIVFVANQLDDEPELSFYWVSTQVGTGEIVPREREDEDRQIHDRRVLETLLTPSPTDLPIQISANVINKTNSEVQHFKPLRKLISFVVDDSEFKERAKTNQLASVNKEFNKLFQTRPRERKEG